MNLPPERAAWPGLEAASSHIGVDLDAAAVDRCTRYRDLLMARNRQFNLTAIRTPDAVERTLFLDALAMLPAMDAMLAPRWPHRASPIRLVDIGAGAGLPGLALKIARPSLDVTLIDATAKKVAFLREAIAALQLDGVWAIHGRAEDLGRDQAFRERFDVGTARGVASLPALLELVTPFLDVGGLAFLPKGMAMSQDEWRSGVAAAGMLGVELLPAVVSPTGETRIVIAQKSTLTPRAYPRRSGLPAHSPLGMGS